MCLASPPRCLLRARYGRLGVLYVIPVKSVSFARYGWSIERFKCSERLHVLVLSIVKDTDVSDC